MKPCFHPATPLSSSLVRVWLWPLGRITTGGGGGEGGDTGGIVGGVGDGGVGAGVRPETDGLTGDGLTLDGDNTGLGDTAREGLTDKLGLTETEGYVDGDIDFGLGLVDDRPDSTLALADGDINPELADSILDTATDTWGLNLDATL